MPARRASASPSSPSFFALHPAFLFCNIRTPSHDALNGYVAAIRRPSRGSSRKLGRVRQWGCRRGRRPSRGARQSKKKINI